MNSRLLAIYSLTAAVVLIGMQVGRCAAEEPPQIKLVDGRPMLDVPDATAASEAEMKPYTDRLTHTNDVRFEMVPIPGGTFMMGSPDDEAGRRDDEGPRHKVEVQPFWMGKHEVTWDEYETFMLCLDAKQRMLEKLDQTPIDKLSDVVSKPTKPYTDMTFGMGKSRYPAICMTQLAARQYCKWLSAKTGRYYRLPTEAEWEYACRAGTDTAFSFGDDVADIDDYAWHYDNCDDSYQKVGQKKPNPWGLHDMHGNVAEWVLDQYEPEHYRQFAGKTTPAAKTWAVPKTLYPRVVRGGSWDDDAIDCRSASRKFSDRGWKEQDPQLPQSIWYHTDAIHVGFRVVRPLVEPSDEEKASFWDGGLMLPEDRAPNKIGCESEAQARAAEAARQP